MERRHEPVGGQMSEKGSGPQGYWKDVFVRRAGRGKLTDACLKGDCEHTPEQHREMAGPVKVEGVWQSNLVVDQIGVLIAGLLASYGDFSPPALYHALGEGDSSWDVSTPDPVVGQTTLLSEAFRKVVVPDFLDALGGAVVGGPTNVLQFQTTFDFGEANGFSIREQGLFGGDATAVADSGQMMDAIHHPRVDKNNTFQWIRTIEMEF
jgi:hypothetical protein